MKKNYLPPVLVSLEIGCHEVFQASYAADMVLPGIEEGDELIFNE